MIDDGESIAKICASIKHEPGYLSLAEQRGAWRKQRQRADASLLARNEDIIRSAKRDLKKAPSKGLLGGGGGRTVEQHDTKRKGEEGQHRTEVESATAVALERDASMEQAKSEDATATGGSKRIFDDYSSDGSDDEGLPDETWMLQATKKLNLK